MSTSTGPPANPSGKSHRTLAFLAVGLLVSLLLAGVVSYYAAADPDGLTKVSEDQGFAGSASAHALDDGPFAGYGTNGVESPRLSGGIAGAVGVGTTFLLVGGLFLLVRGRTSRSPQEAAEGPRSDVPS